MSSDIRRMTAIFGAIVRQPGAFGNSKRQRKARPACVGLSQTFDRRGICEFSVIQARLSCRITRTHDAQSPSAVDATGSYFSGHPRNV